MKNLRRIKSLKKHEDYEEILEEMGLDNFHAENGYEDSEFDLFDELNYQLHKLDIIEGNIEYHEDVLEMDDDEDEIAESKAELEYWYKEREKRNNKIKDVKERLVAFCKDLTER